MSMVVAGQAALILLREGAEALLVIAALASYLARLGQAGRTVILYGGAGLAVAISLVLAWVMERFLDGGHNDIVEGLVMLLAAGVLVYVAGWLIARRDAGRWREHLAGQVGRALRQDSLIALGLAAFLAVFREGAETILFLHALAAGQGGWNVSVAAGVLAGLGALLILFVLVRALAIRLPLKLFFTATAALLYGMAFLFVGQAIQEFQEMAWVSVTSADLPEFLVALGLNPSWEALAAQFLLVAAAAGFAWLENSRLIVAVRPRPVA
ncbi:MAG: FTR1 family protein [Rhodospirillales bacterium]|nr:FTR1 family protein [Rhodospirillales bacterium]